MKFEYNGVVMDLVEMTEYQREAVYSEDGADLLYVKHRVGAVCTLGAGGWPAGLAVEPSFSQSRTTQDLTSNTTPITSRGGDDIGFVRGRSGAQYAFPKREPNYASRAAVDPPAFWTDQEVRMRLMIPRRTLKITAYRSGDGAEYAWLVSPRPFSRPPHTSILNGPGGSTGSAVYDETPSDAANGPIPLRCDVVAPSGEAGVFGVHFMIETCLVPVAPEEERVILSHRWEVRHQHDENHFLTRVTNGVVVFNGGLVRAGGQSPDWYRNQFFHPVPTGFKRGVPEVVASSDGLSIRYTITDTDPTVCFDPGDSGATNMQIVESLNYISPLSV